MSTTVASRIVRPMLALGPPALEVLARSNVKVDELDDPDARVDYRVMIELLELAERLTGNQSIGVQGAVHESATLSVLEFMLRSSRTVLDALERVARYQNLLHDACRFSVDCRENEAVVLLDALPRAPYPPAVVEFFSASLVLGLYKIGVSAKSLTISFTHPPPRDFSIHQAILRAPIEWSAASNSIRLAGEVLRQPLPQADPALAEVLERHADKMLARLRPVALFPERVRRAILDELPGVAPTQVSIARRLRTSTRTLRRRLAEEGTSFHEILDDVRQSMALELYESRDVEAEEAAFLLGFSEASAYRRAFKRWTGRSVSEHRRALRA